MTARVVDLRFKCDTQTFQEDVTQFYLFADTDRYISNSVAEKKIKEENTQILVRNFINKILKTENKCKRI